MITELTDRCIAVEIDKTAYGFKVNNEYGVLWYQMPPLRGFLSIELPEGNWSILGRPHQIKGEYYKAIMGEDEDNLFEFLELKKVDHYGVIILIKQ